VDDGGFLSSNLGTVPVSTPVQAANIGGAFIGQGHGKGSTDTTSIAGGKLKATGPGGAGAGNIIEAPVALPLQAMGVGGALGGIGTGENDNITDAKAGGDALTDGRDGALTGNIVKAPIAGAGSVFGDGIAGAALGTGKGTNDVESEAGGNATTNGDRGSVAGNIVGVDPLAVAQVFGDAVSVAGVAKGAGVNMTEVENAGDDTTSGVEGAISGNILDLPVTAIAQLFGDAVTVGGVADAVGDNTLTTQNGGKAVTAGDQSSLSGINGYHAFALPVQIFGVPLELLGAATAHATDMTSIDEEAADPIAFPAEGSELAADELPSLAALRSGLPTRGGLPTAGGVPSVDGLMGKLPVGALLGGLPSLDGLTGAVQASELPAGSLPTQRVSSLTGLAGNLPAAGLPVAAPLATERADVPSVGGFTKLLPATGTPALPALPTASVLPAVSGLAALGEALPGNTGRADVPAAGLPVAVPALGGVPALPKPAMPALPTASALPAVNGLSTLGSSLGGHGTERADVPALPALPTASALPTLPTASALPTLPTASALPTTSALSALGGALPGHTQRADLPVALPAAPAVPVNAKLPVLDSTPQVPAMSGLDSTGFLAKLMGLVKRK